ncbi:NAD(P)/FAD-dependent oxidoreductase [Desertivirga brevis]|uniref:NAD(P)/FAD-dependent oxidoreductase n=1 Tax=Desertivirga brevis TaxID=2810310 RepID=UPI001A97D119|nr:NAD(P)/FAD-dependent oxidoreductase [Pedobacter sp. SYSU D00873]
MAILTRDKPTVTIIGGGLAGLICSIVLSRNGFPVILIEKKQYPFHRVCGEYISNEVVSFLKRIDIDLYQLNPSNITQLAISSVSGQIFKTNLDLGGVGLSRFVLDDYLYRTAQGLGVEVVLGLKATDITFHGNGFDVLLEDSRVITSNFVICSHGKRSNLDRSRSFFSRRSPFIGVKYHIRTDFPANLVQLDNFEKGYCGTVKIEDEKYCLCYLSHNNNIKNYGNLKEMEKAVLFKNPILKSLFESSEFLYEKPEVINEISFERKTLVENHILFCGDAAGMISPLCGNGMAMAIHSAKILCDTLNENYLQERAVIEQIYRRKWQHHFANRLAIGRLTQKLFGGKVTSELAIRSLRTIKPLSNFIIRRTHGAPF